jgi:hypothetical protein
MYGAGDRMPQTSGRGNEKRVTKTFAVVFRFYVLGVKSEPEPKT